MKAALLALAVVARCGATAPAPTPAPRVLQLLASAEEKETTARTELREDVEFANAEAGRSGFIVARGLTPPLTLQGQEARLAGDPECTKGFEVDNVVLLEVLDAGGRVTARAAVGFTEGLSVGRERVDLLGRQSFTFEPLEVNLTPLLPEAAPFSLKATVLDNSGVGRVSDVFLCLRARPGSDDDLRSQ